MINVVLFEPEIPQNTGNIMRTCVATNCVLHLIKPLGFKLDDKSVKRSAVNYLDKLEYHLYENFEDFSSNNKGMFCFFTRYGNKNHTMIDFKLEENIYLIFGKESTGIDKKILKQNIDSCIRIPTTDNVRALNLSNAVAIAVYEVYRQKDFKNLLPSEPFKGKHFLEE